MKTKAEAAKEFLAQKTYRNATIAFESVVVELGSDLSSININHQFGHTIDFKDGSVIRFIDRTEGWYAQTQDKRVCSG